MKIQFAIGTALMTALAAPGAFAQATTPRARAAQIVRSDRPWLGIGVKDITDAEQAKKFNLKETRGVEITNEVADGPQSAVQQQVRNGVAVRMAVLATIVRNVQLRNVEAGRRVG